MTNPTYQQRNFRIRNDDGSESAATWKQAINVNTTVGTLDRFRVRLDLYNNNTRAGTTDWTWQYNRNAAGWNAITTSSSYIQNISSTYYADGDATTQQIGSGAY